MVLTTAQKAPLIVTDPATGDVLTKAMLAGFVTTDNAVISVDESGAVLFIVANLAGSSRVLVNLPDGRAGALTVEVQHAPLVLSLGDAEPK